MFRASSRAPARLPLPFLRRRHPLRTALLQIRLLRRWIYPEKAPMQPRAGTVKRQRTRRALTIPT